MLKEVFLYFNLVDSYICQVLRTFDSMLSEGVTSEMVKAGIDLQTHMSVSVAFGYSLNSFKFWWLALI